MPDLLLISYLTFVRFYARPRSAYASDSIHSAEISIAANEFLALARYRQLFRSCLQNTLTAYEHRR
jgi:hypothetical protein